MVECSFDEVVNTIQRIIAQERLKLYLRLQFQSDCARITLTRCNNGTFVIVIGVVTTSLLEIDDMIHGYGEKMLFQHVSFRLQTHVRQGKWNSAIGDSQEQLINENKKKYRQVLTFTLAGGKITELSRTTASDKNYSF